MRLPVLLVFALSACSAGQPAVQSDAPLLGQSFVITIENDTEDAIRVYGSFEQDRILPLGDIQSQRTRSFKVAWENNLFRVAVRSATRTRAPLRWSESIHPEIGDSLALRWWGSWPSGDLR